MTDTDKRLNEVIRVKRKPSNFVTMNKSFLEDNRLSYKAKGILAYLLSKPDDWKVIVGNLVNYATDGKASVYAGLKELKECGYYEKVPVRNEQGTRIIRWESTVYEVPPSLLSDFQEVENLQIEKEYIENQHIEKQDHNNNNKTQNEKEYKNHVQSCPKTDELSEVTKLVALIHENIDYSSLQIAHVNDIPLIDEFVNIIVDTLLSQSETIRINGEQKSRELVKSNLLKLTYEDIQYVLEQFQNHKKKITKKHQYILSMLYNATLEKHTHYTNLVQVDWG